MDNEFAAPQIFALMEKKYILIAVGTCRSNAKVFDSEKLILIKNMIYIYSNDWLKDVLTWL